MTAGKIIIQFSSVAQSCLTLRPDESQHQHSSNISALAFQAHDRITLSDILPLNGAI